MKKKDESTASLGKKQPDKALIVSNIGVSEELLHDFYSLCEQELYDKTTSAFENGLTIKADGDIPILHLKHMTIAPENGDYSQSIKIIPSYSRTNEFPELNAITLSGDYEVVAGNDDNDEVESFYSEGFFKRHEEHLYDKPKVENHPAFQILSNNQNIKAAFTKYEKLAKSSLENGYGLYKMDWVRFVGKVAGYLFFLLYDLDNDALLSKTKKTIKSYKKLLLGNNSKKSQWGAVPQLIDLLHQGYGLKNAVDNSQLLGLLIKLEYEAESGSIHISESHAGIEPRKRFILRLGTKYVPMSRENRTEVEHMITDLLMCVDGAYADEKSVRWNEVSQTMKIFYDHENNVKKAKAMREARMTYLVNN